LLTVIGKIELIKPKSELSTKPLTTLSIGELCRLAIGVWQRCWRFSGEFWFWLQYFNFANYS